MGVNAQTAVPAFTAGQVLTAAQMTQVNTGIPVFADTTARDAAFGGAGEKVLAEGQFAYIEASNTTQYYDGSSWASVGVTPGLTIVQAATTFTTVSAINVNSVFTSTYTNYRIVFNPSAASAGGSITVKMRASGTDTSTNYATRTFYGSPATGGVYASDSLGTDEWYLGNISTTSGTGNGVIDIYNPQTTVPTAITAQFLGGETGVGIFTYLTAGHQNSATQFDGLSFLISAGTFTGTYTIYGYSK